MAGEGQLNTDGVNLLVGMLISYPEISKILYEPKDESLNITFIVKEVLADTEFAEFKMLIERNLEAYYSLEKIWQRRVTLEKQTCGGFTFIQLKRDIATVSKGEMALLAELVQQRYGGRLVDDGTIIVLDDDLVLQDDFVDNMLNNIRINKISTKLIGMREDGRVMIFNK